MVLNEYLENPTRNNKEFICLHIWLNTGHISSLISGRISGPAGYLISSKTNQVSVRIPDKKNCRKSLYCISFTLLSVKTRSRFARSELEPSKVATSSATLGVSTVPVPFIIRRSNCTLFLCNMCL